MTPRESFDALAPRTIRSWLLKMESETPIWRSDPIHHNRFKMMLRDVIDEDDYNRRNGLKVKYTGKGKGVSAFGVSF